MVVRDLLEVFSILLDECVEFLIQVEVEVFDLAEKQGWFFELFVGGVVDQEVLVDKVVTLDGEPQPDPGAVCLLVLCQDLNLDVVVHRVYQTVNLA